MTSVKSFSNYKVVVTGSYWALSGVNIFSANLVRQLRVQGVDAHLLLTEQDTNCVNISDPLMKLPEDIPVEFLPVRREQSWGAHWGAMIRYLESLSPCIYIPNADWRHSSISPFLSDRVSIVGIVHSDDPLHYDHVKRLGAYWNSIVTVSKKVGEKTTSINPLFADRIITIPIGVESPSAYPVRTVTPGNPLQLFYHGLLIQRQKRVFDLPQIVQRLKEANVPVELSIAGSGDQQPELLQKCEPLMKEGLIRFLGLLPHAEILKLLEKQDIFIMTSEFEGMPNALLEAMAHGCIPVVTGTESGIPDILQDGRNGFIVPVGDISAFRDRLSVLYKDEALRMRVSMAAYNTIHDGPYNLTRMTDTYVALFKDVMFKSSNGMYRRPHGPIASPPYQVDGISILPIDYPFDAPGFGKFASEHDYREFQAELARLKKAKRENSLIWRLPGAKSLRKSIRKVAKNIIHSRQGRPPVS